MKNLYSIGELARYQNISKQTLIFYDKIGLFRPAYVDPDNGYRYYSPKQLDYLDTILIMKKVGFSLEEIREHMSDYNLENSTALLKRQVEVLEGQIQELQLIKSRLQHRCGVMETAGKYRENPIIIGNTEEQYIMVQPVEAPYSLEEVSIATKKCFAESFEKKLPIYFQTGVINPLERIRQGRYMEASYAFISTEFNTEASGLKRLEAGRCASIYHFGDYESIGKSYSRLVRYCDERQIEICSDSYEFCINDYITSGDEKEYITKIMFYIK